MSCSAARRSKRVSVSGRELVAEETDSVSMCEEKISLCSEKSAY